MGLNPHMRAADEERARAERSERPPSRDLAETRRTHRFQEEYMLHTIRKRINDERGFTLIELLVVILIIGILAAIAIPSFLSQKDKAGDASAKSFARNMQTAEETYYTDNNRYTVTLSELQAIEPVLRDTPSPTAPTLSATDVTRDFRVTATSKAGVGYSITRASDGTTTRSCDRPNIGGCNAGSSW
jgi:type IV pilus assembly protein PilA